MPSASPQPKAYSYIRFSSLEQAKGDSFRRQTEGIRNYCTKNGLDLATSAEYTFFDKGKSAYKADHVGENGQLKRFIDLVESGHIKKGSYLIVE
ncbi:recombinase family protein [Halopseudomonas sp.]|uniref:recombinase family protein n=1 Tax=Halopseudomonas sp. TaxID=2901191 RepID=UPI00311E6CB3